MTSVPDPRTPPTEALRALQDLCGQPLAADLVSSRRGSQVWQLTGHGLRLALKANLPDSKRSSSNARELAQEDATLTELSEAKVIGPRYRFAAGDWHGGRWLAVRWTPGAPMFDAFGPVRGKEGDRRPSRPWLLSISQTWARQLSALHAAGWTHAAVQPGNAIATQAGTTEVIDYALACGPTPPHVPYRGALTHTTAPEIADALLSTPADEHIQALPPSDVWSIGASLYWCWTGRRPVAYENADRRADKLRAIAKGQTRDLDKDKPYDFRQFEELIRACLRSDPAERPTAADVAERAIW